MSALNFFEISLVRITFVLAFLHQCVIVFASKKKDLYVYGYDKFPNGLPTVEMESIIDQVRYDCLIFLLFSNNIDIENAAFQMLS